MSARGTGMSPAQGWGHLVGPGVLSPQHQYPVRHPAQYTARDILGRVSDIGTRQDIGRGVGRRHTSSNTPSNTPSNTLSSTSGTGYWTRDQTGYWTGCWTAPHTVQHLVQHPVQLPVQSWVREQIQCIGRGVRLVIGRGSGLGVQAHAKTCISGSDGWSKG